MINLLFVHSDDKLTSLYSNKLKEFFKVHSAVDGLSAVRKVRQIEPKIVISDYDLPFLSGKTLIKFVRNYPPTQDSLFIFISKNHLEPEALNLGANAWLVSSSSTPDVLLEQTFYLLKVNSKKYV